MALYFGNTFLTNDVGIDVDIDPKWEQYYIDYLDGYLVIPSEVENIRKHAFSSNPTLKTVLFEENSKCSTLGDFCFSNCTSLSEITIPSSVLSIGENCFQNCVALTTITINKPENSISGAPWNAPSATIVWNG